jgi:hypothetical protein
LPMARNSNALPAARTNRERRFIASLPKKQSRPPIYRAYRAKADT